MTSVRTRVFNRLSMTSNFYTSENTRLLILAVCLGLATGIAIWVFRTAIDFFHEIFIEGLQHELSQTLIGSGAAIFSLALAGLLVGWLMNRFVGEERHHGVAGIMESVALIGGRLPYQRMPFKALASSISLGAGASVGPEDPSVQIGANLGSMIGQKTHLSEEQVKLLVAAGAASAIAAAFKAPIAGVFFALEVILYGSFSSAAVGVVVLSAVISSAFTQAIEPHPEMGPFAHTLSSPLEIPLFVPLGILLGPIASLFIRWVYFQHDWWHHHIHLPRPLRTALAGVLVGMVAIFLPEIMGTGRETMNEVLSGEAKFALTLLLILGTAKLLMTGVSIAGGFVGGIFAPSLFVGTMLGGAYGLVMDRIIGGGSHVTPPEVYAVAGMAGMMAGVVRSPITAIMLVFELTNDYRLILPIMLTTVICVLIAERIEPSGMYILGLRRKGIHLQEGRDIDLMQGVKVGDAMLKPAPSISEKASLVELRDTLRKLRTFSMCVVDDDGSLSGIVTLSDLQRAYDNTHGEKSLTVGDICTRNPITVTPDDVLWTAIRCMSVNDVGRLPVVEPGTHKLVGFIGRHGVMRAYNIAIARKLEDQHTAERLRLKTLTGAHTYEYYLTTNAPANGKRIQEIQWPTESVVASVQRGGRLIVPHGSTQLLTGDKLTLVADPLVENELAYLLEGRTLPPH
ncbi:MAG: CBS domain-containing protein [Chloroflexi bacterium]|nr:CBS domain-containing protein [Chloroflexota bacterium]NOG66418.1 CBS domain-containing protein [Chloroflexota bacterium]